MAGSNETMDAAPDLKLEAPDPVPTVQPEKAAGLVPVDEGTKSKLDERVDSFIDDLLAQDVNSPEFGKRVDQISAMVQREIREAAAKKCALSLALCSRLSTPTLASCVYVCVCARARARVCVCVFQSGFNSRFCARPEA